MVIPSSCVHKTPSSEYFHQWLCLISCREEREKLSLLNYKYCNFSINSNVMMVLQSSRKLFFFFSFLYYLNLFVLNNSTEIFGWQFALKSYNHRRFSIILVNYHDYYHQNFHKSIWKIKYTLKIFQLWFIARFVYILFLITEILF